MVQKAQECIVLLVVSLRPLMLLGSLNFNNALYWLSSLCMHEKSVFGKIPEGLNFIYLLSEQKWNNPK